MTNDQKNQIRKEYQDGCHEHKGSSWKEYDAQGIYLCRVCKECEEVALEGYRPEILTGYNQNDVDEDINP